MVASALFVTSMAALVTTPTMPSPQLSRTRHRCAAPRNALFKRRMLEVGDEWEGLLSKITEYGVFVKMGHEQHMGLIHVSELTKERMPRDHIPRWIEENVGPVGSKVRVEVLRLEFRGVKRTSLRMIEVITQQNMEDLVFAPGPRRARHMVDESQAQGS